MKTNASEVLLEMGVPESYIKDILLEGRRDAIREFAKRYITIAKKEYSSMGRILVIETVNRIKQEMLKQ